VISNFVHGLAILSPSLWMTNDSKKGHDQCHVNRLTVGDPNHIFKVGEAF